MSGNKSNDPSGTPSQDIDGLQAILSNPSYAEADRDVGFLDTEETRGVRLQLDYLKAELILKRDGITDTVVVFGSTRIGETSPFYQVARALGERIGRLSQSLPTRHLTVMTGGGPGIMEAANRGAHEVGSRSVGLNIRLAEVQEPNRYVTPHLCFQFHYFAIRKLHLLLRARALVVFPGGFGTLDELFEVLTLLQTRKIPPLPVVLVGEAFWRRAIDFDFLMAEGLIDPQDRQLFCYAETAAAVVDAILLWHRERGSPFC